MSDKTAAEKFARMDAEFEAFKNAHPGKSFAEFYVHKAMDKIGAGASHTTLGEHLHSGGGGDRQDVDFEEAGRSAVERYIRLGPIRPDMRVVDYGCGSLRLGIHLIRLLDPGCYFGLDVTTDFIDIGKRIVGDELLGEKKPRFGAIGSAVDEATAFDADIVVSNAVAYHVHPDEIGSYFDNLKRLAHKRGAVLMFDAKISDVPGRYRQRGWSWPFAHYADGLKPLEYRGQPPKKESSVLVFRRP